ncbi:hypothetical protein PMAYCL1PPCAC_23561 [Pristionchus mayeri]|uniref:Uncharacterized protein n=1 Tax=Pristionchus mayeri TaxID=1317129 RepID=A0AAN5CZ18_9BILA|nr:hypothetical protein PMAYCL1PPCAC_23561 [Pristionchus mayeri]
MVDCIYKGEDSMDAFIVLLWMEREMLDMGRVRETRRMHFHLPRPTQILMERPNGRGWTQLIRGRVEERVSRGELRVVSDVEVGTDLCQLPSTRHVHPMSHCFHHSGGKEDCLAGQEFQSIQD